MLQVNGQRHIQEFLVSLAILYTQGFTKVFTKIFEIAQFCSRTWAIIPFARYQLTRRGKACLLKMIKTFKKGIWGFC